MLHEFMLLRWSKGLLALRVGASHSKSAPYLVQCTWVFCKWRYNRFNLWFDFTRPPHWEVMWIYWWEFLVVSSPPWCDHRHCESGDMFSNHHMVSHDHISKGLSYLNMLLAISCVQVEIYNIQFMMWLRKTTWFKDHVTLWVGTPHCISPHSQIWWL